MNKEWAELNKTVQTKMKKEGTYREGVEVLLELRKQLFHELLQMKTELGREIFNAMPFLHADGYHSKTIAYSIWHIFRIEDIVAHTLIGRDEQIFFSGDYQKRTGSPIITTGNELAGQQIADFSETLNLDELYRYITDVKISTEDMLKGLSFADLKRKMTDADKERLKALGVVSEDDKAYWLIDYWCGKNVRGLIQMPFSRHWIMHVEASLRIRNKIKNEGH
ncbi:MAG: phage head-tail adapter protein [Lachnospiraceae bacterium]|nr:phage head-tail adapter protein [Lachnospiraceae bacterium]